MSVIVAKFGGTSLATPARILHAARRVAAWRRRDDIVVVVSAMGHHTDELVALSRQVSPRPSAREMDMLLTAGERISVALFSMALGRMKLDAVSFTGSQVGIITDMRHTDARILEIRGDRIRQALQAGSVPVVCGFQGVSMTKEITTLGRGGSDTTALALSAVLGARECRICTDVKGVYTEDPHQFPGARLIDRIGYEEMLELAHRGAQVLHPRACAVATRYRVPVRVQSTFSQQPGTLVTEADGMERSRPRALTHAVGLYLATLARVPRKPAFLSQVVKQLSDRGVHVKFFFHGISDAPRFDLSFITPIEERTLVRQVLAPVTRQLGVKGLSEMLDICSVTVVGAGVGSDQETLSAVFSTLAKINVHIEAMTTSELSINLFLHRRFLKRAVRALLRSFDLAHK